MTKKNMTVWSSRWPFTSGLLSGDPVLAATAKHAVDSFSADPEKRRLVLKAYAPNMTRAIQAPHGPWPVVGPSGFDRDFPSNCGSRFD